METRAIIKRAMKAYSGLPGMSDVVRGLDAKQLAIKLLSNVMYGYTSATFSGRCCCPVLADAIVELGRRTLSGAMEEAETMGRGEWKGAEIVYGDTDSVFIRLPGRSAEEGWSFGEEVRECGLRSERGEERIFAPF